MGLAILIVWVIILGIAMLTDREQYQDCSTGTCVYSVERLGGYKETWGSDFILRCRSWIVSREESH